jgi:hypothetical protein
MGVAQRPPQAPEVRARAVRDEAAQPVSARRGSVGGMRAGQVGSVEAEQEAVRAETDRAVWVAAERGALRAEVDRAAWVEAEREAAPGEVDRAAWVEAGPEAARAATGPAAVAPGARRTLTAGPTRVTTRTREVLVAHRSRRLDPTPRVEAQSHASAWCPYPNR